MTSTCNGALNRLNLVNVSKAIHICWVWLLKEKLVFISQARVVLKPLVLLIGRLTACRISIKTEKDRQTKYYNPRFTCEPCVEIHALPCKWKALKCKPLANCACAVPLIDGLGLLVCVYPWSPASSSRRVWHGLATVVDSMRESIHALRCDFLCLWGTQIKRIRSR